MTSPRARAGLRLGDLPGPRDPRRGSVARTRSKDSPTEVATTTSHGKPASRRATYGVKPNKRVEGNVHFPRQHRERQAQP